MDTGNVFETSDPNHLPGIRIILLGRKWSGKSQAGNTILGQEGFFIDDETVENMKREGVIGGRWRVTVVETPGWWKSFSLRETMALVKTEIVHSVSLCTPGPHAFLLVIDLDTILEEKHRKSVEEHLELLGERAWRHTIVLLNYGAWQKKYTEIEEYMKKRGTVLQGLITKCGNRYHILNNKNKGMGSQVTELMEKIEEMVAGNDGRLFEVDSKISQNVEKKRKEVNERAQQREIKVKTERDTIRELFKGEAHRLSELRLVLLGWVLSGKTRVADTIVGVPMELKEIRRTSQNVQRKGQVGGRAVTIVDTPGWFHYASLCDTPEMVKQGIVNSVSLCPPGPHAVILVMEASISFTEAHLRSVREHMRLLGPNVWRHALVLFTWCDTLGKTTIEKFIESEGRPLQWLLRKCDNRYHTFDNTNNDVLQVTELLEKIEWIVTSNSILKITAGGQSGEADDWEASVKEPETVKEPHSPGESLMAMFEEVCRRKEKELLESIRTMLVKPEEASSHLEPPYMSSNEVDQSHEKVHDWLRLGHSGGVEETSEYESNPGSTDMES